MSTLALASKRERGLGPHEPHFASGMLVRKPHKLMLARYAPGYATAEDMGWPLVLDFSHTTNRAYADFAAEWSHRGLVPTRATPRHSS